MINKQRKKPGALIAGLLLLVVVAAADDTREVQVTGDIFDCLAEMTPVRHFYVDNLLDNLDGTLAIANSEEGGKYPPGR